MRTLIVLAGVVALSCGGSGNGSNSTAGSGGSDSATGTGGSGGSGNDTSGTGGSSADGIGGNDSGGGLVTAGSSGAGQGAGGSGGSGGSGEAGGGGSGGSGGDTGGSGGSGGGDDLCADVDCSANEGPCLRSECDPDTGGCLTEPVDDGTACDDDDLCNGRETCSAGSCQTGESLDCDDDNACTDDSCDPEAGCQNEDNANECDDGNPCTEGDACEAGSCVSGANQCSCEANEDCEAAEDDNLCNGTLVCEDNECVVDEDTVVVCNTSEDTTCRATVCNPESGDCEQTNLTGGCNDQDPCSFDDECVGGECQGTAYECSDELSCTNDSCNGEGGCEYALLSGCLIDDACVAQGEADPDNECRTCRSGVSTTDYSDAPSTTPCDDGNACTFVDRCSAGSCGSADEPSWPEGTEIIIVSVSLSDTSFVARNVSGAALDISDWYVCLGADDPYPALPSNIPVLANSAEITIHVGASGTDDASNVYAIGGTVLPDADELALYVNSSFASSSSIRAYLRYQRDGAGGGSTSRQSVAAGHDPPLWTTGNVIQLDADQDGFVAVGNVTGASGYAPTTDACL